MTQEGITKKCNFHDPWTGALVLGRVYLSHYNSVYALSFTLSIYDTLIVIVLRDNTAQGIIILIQLNADSLYSFSCRPLCLLCLIIVKLIILKLILIESRSILIV